MTPIELLELLNSQPDGIAKLSPIDGRYLFANDRELIYRDISRDELRSVSIFNFFTADENAELKQLFLTCVNTPDTAPIFFTYQSGALLFEMTLVKTKDNCIASTLKDITKQHSLEQLQKEQQESIKCLNDAVTSANVGCWDFYPKQERILANKTWVTQKGYKDSDYRVDTKDFSEVSGGLSKWASIVHPDDLEKTSALITQHLNGETPVYDAIFRMKFGDGQWHWIHDIGKVTSRDSKGSALRMNGVHIDITSSKKLELEIERISSTDTLTGILNRRNFESIFKSAINASRQHQTLICFLIIDIDLFKEFNDTYGHQEGDRILESVGAALNSSLSRHGDYCFRLGGEEFGVIFNADTHQSAISFSEKIKSNIERVNLTHQTNGSDRFITVSMGLQCKGHKEKTTSVKEMYRQADELLYQAKRNGRNQICY
ncbi:diguanylate cyclase [Psychrobium sp. 1_MG-2023]|uniref:sensor domain-containing diguanylate cyclase n=1 Tax=Psychrobium sp. 1_MG-2023 TaxID=3062624 RepID=UPI000C333CE3|nr:diguanylate cyclase [Psychrobium sp. 1_MG-2023]MDP2561814.1 diguanylate cyclase [Psychrobium sp. 1_MG-2023]PKF55813.1 hypothetical protein CW748_11775 [Alteromonadales bacterium alter-6D02]